MRAWRVLVGVVGAMMILGGAVRAQPGRPGGAEGMRPDEAVRRILVKHYIELSPTEVVEAATSGARADVRLTDTFDAPVPLIAPLELIPWGPQVIPVALALRTEGGVTVLVPRDQRDTLEKVGALTKGQALTIEGTIAGRIGDYKCVLVDRILTGYDEPSVVDYELVVSWPGHEGFKQRVFIKPGDYELEFPCRYKKGAADRLLISIEKSPRAEFMAEQEKREEADGKARPPKVYRTYKPDAVYQYAGAGTIIDVRFTDRVLGPSRTFTLPAVVAPGFGPVPIGYAFDTETDLTCVIPAREQALIQQAQRTLGGQDVLVEGTVIGQVSAHKVVLVHSLEFPGVKPQAEPTDIWIVNLFWGNEKPMRLYEVGAYPSLRLPCQNAEKKSELLGVELREILVIKGKREGEEQAEKPGESKGK